MVKYKTVLQIRGITKLNGKFAGLNSPTETLKDDIVTEMGSETITVGKIDKICLVDDSGTERDCTTSLTYVDNSPDNVQVKASIQATADYTVSKVRAYSGSKLYFESSVSATLYSGDVLDVTLEITATLTCSLSGSATQSNYDVDRFITYLLKRLIGAETVLLSLSRAKLMYYSEQEGTYVSGLTIDLSLSYDTSTNKVTGSGSGTATFDFEAQYLAYDNDGGSPVDLVEQWFSTPIVIYNGTVVNISYEFTVA